MEISANLRHFWTISGQLGQGLFVQVWMVLEKSKSKTHVVFRGKIVLCFLPQTNNFFAFLQSASYGLKIHQLSSSCNEPTWSSGVWQTGKPALNAKNIQHIPSLLAIAYLQTARLLKFLEAVKCVILDQQTHHIL